MVFTKEFDLLLIKFQKYLPILYGLLIYIFPSYDLLVAFIFLMLLAEPHFGATWPFLFNKVNKPMIKNEKFFFIYSPILISIAALISYMYVSSLFFLIFFLINVYHVTRQSVGISKLYLKKDSMESVIQEYSIYIANIILFIIAIGKFYLGIINEGNIIYINIILLILFFVFLIFYINKFGFSENILQAITGIIIFSPVCFIDKPIHAIVMGVSMHYIQYIALTFKVEKERRNQIENKAVKFNLNFIFIIIFYGVIMAVLSLSNNLNHEIFKHLLFIPLLGQLLHFYLDGFLWRFSEPHHRNNTLKHLKA